MSSTNANDAERNTSSIIVHGNVNTNNNNNTKNISNEENVIRTDVSYRKLLQQRDNDEHFAYDNHDTNSNKDNDNSTYATAHNYISRSLTEHYQMQQQQLQEKRNPKIPINSNQAYNLRFEYDYLPRTPPPPPPALQHGGRTITTTPRINPFLAASNFKKFDNPFLEKGDGRSVQDHRDVRSGNSIYNTTSMKRGNKRKTFLDKLEEKRFHSLKFSNCATSCTRYDNGSNCNNSKISTHICGKGSTYKNNLYHSKPIPETLQFTAMESNMLQNSSRNSFNSLNAIGEVSGPLIHSASSSNKKCKRHHSFAGGSLSDVNPKGPLCSTSLHYYGAPPTYENLKVRRECEGRENHSTKQLATTAILLHSLPPHTHITHTHNSSSGNGRATENCTINKICGSTIMGPKKKHHQSQHQQREDLNLIEPECLSIYRSDSGISNSSCECVTPLQHHNQRVLTTLISPNEQVLATKTQARTHNTPKSYSATSKLHKTNLIMHSNTTTIGISGTGNTVAGGYLSEALQYLPPPHYVNINNTEQCNGGDINNKRSSSPNVITSAYESASSSQNDGTCADPTSLSSSTSLHSNKLNLELGRCSRHHQQCQPQEQEHQQQSTEMTTPEEPFEQYHQLGHSSLSSLSVASSTSATGTGSSIMINNINWSKCRNQATQENQQQQRSVYSNSLNQMKLTNKSPLIANQFLTAKYEDTTVNNAIGTNIYCKKLRRQTIGDPYTHIRYIAECRKHRGQHSNNTDIITGAAYNNNTDNDSQNHRSEWSNNNSNVNNAIPNTNNNKQSNYNSNSYHNYCLKHPNDDTLNATSAARTPRAATATPEANNNKSQQQYDRQHCQQHQHQIIINNSSIINNNNKTYNVRKHQLYKNDKQQYQQSQQYEQQPHRKKRMLMYSTGGHVQVNQQNANNVLVTGVCDNDYHNDDDDSDNEKEDKAEMQIDMEIETATKHKHTYSDGYNNGWYYQPNNHNMKYFCHTINNEDDDDNDGDNDNDGCDRNVDDKSVGTHNLKIHQMKTTINQILPVNVTTTAPTTIITTTITTTTTATTMTKTSYSIASKAKNSIDFIMRPVKLPLRKYHTFHFQTSQTVVGQQLGKLKKYQILEKQQRQRQEKNLSSLYPFDKESPLVYSPLHLTENVAFKPINPVETSNETDDNDNVQEKSRKHIIHINNESKPTNVCQMFKQMDTNFQPSFYTKINDNNECKPKILDEDEPKEVKNFISSKRLEFSPHANKMRKQCLKRKSSPIRFSEGLITSSHNNLPQLLEYSDQQQHYCDLERFQKNLYHFNEATSLKAITLPKRHSEEKEAHLKENEYELEKGSKMQIALPINSTFRDNEVILEDDKVCLESLELLSKSNPELWDNAQARSRQNMHHQLQLFHSLQNFKKTLNICSNNNAKTGGSVKEAKEQQNSNELDIDNDLGYIFYEDKDDKDNDNDDDNRHCT